MLHPECKELPEPNLLPGQLSHGAVGVKEGRVQWISMAFESVSLGALCRVLILKTCPHPFLSLSPDKRERDPGFGLGHSQQLTVSGTSPSDCISSYFLTPVGIKEGQETLHCHPHVPGSAKGDTETCVHRCAHSYTRTYIP